MPWPIGHEPYGAILQIVQLNQDLQKRAPTLNEKNYIYNNNKSTQRVQTSIFVSSLFYCSLLFVF